ncbi:MAG: preprotein translocase subunit SecD [Thermosediminibacterales bacterium]|nr:preprotein translocase subunit SecD [Thermosediminibacterales bacterium]
MEVKSLIKIFFVIVIVAAIAYSTIFGVKIGEYSVIPLKDAINLGLDLQGGVYILLEAEEKPGQKVTDEKMKGAVEVIRGRVDELGVAEPIIARQGDTRIRVELPGVKDTEKALSIIGQTASLRFIGPDGKVILTGNDVKDARAVYGNQNEPLVQLKLNPEGVKKFADATKKFLGQPISIFLDERMISSPVVRNVITTGEAVIEGLPSIDKAGELAMLIRAGALPVNLTKKEIRAVGPTLGKDSLDKSIKAAKYGIIIVLLFMLAYYRLPGLVADFALFVYVLLDLIVLASIGATLTLPGIAGLILSIGMAVDANIIIFERIKEELKLGKTLRAAIDAGFSRAFKTILDANITTLIAAAVLFYFGSGPIRGFGVTLSIGIIVSMFTAIVVTKFLLVQLVRSKIVVNTKYYGA